MTIFLLVIKDGGSDVAMTTSRPSCYQGNLWDGLTLAGPSVKVDVLSPDWLKSLLPFLVLDGGPDGSTHTATLLLGIVAEPTGNGLKVVVISRYKVFFCSYSILY